MNQIENGRIRVIIENVRPEIDAGRFPIKRVVGEKVKVLADIFTDGHDAISALVLYKKEGAPAWQEIPMRPLGNDVWEAEFTVTELGCYLYSVCAWVDHFESWRHDLKRRVQSDDIALALRTGAEWIEKTAARASKEDARLLKKWQKTLLDKGDVEDRR